MGPRRELEAVLQPEGEGGFSVFVPALPGCVSQGETREEALAMIKEAIEGCLESLDAHGDPVPRPVEVERVTVGLVAPRTESRAPIGHRDDACDRARPRDPPTA